MDQRKLQELATQYTAAWCSQDPARVASFFAETGSLTVNDGEPAVGTEAITNVARGFMTAFPDMVVLMDSLVVGANQVVYHWTLIGTNTGPGGTGNAVHISGREEWMIGDDGLIVRSKGYFNEAEYRRQLGQGADAAPDESVQTLPADVMRFAERRDLCDHFRGEEPYDEERRQFLENALRKHCTGADAELAGLREKYKGNITIMERLAEYEDHIEGNRRGRG